MNKCKCNKQSIKVAVCGLRHITDQMTLLFGNLCPKISQILIVVKFNLFQFFFTMQWNIFNMAFGQITII